MADEPNRFMQIVTALREIQQDSLKEQADYIRTRATGGFHNTKDTPAMRVYEAATIASMEPGLIEQLAKKLFGEVAE